MSIKTHLVEIAFQIFSLFRIRNSSFLLLFRTKGNADMCKKEIEKALKNGENIVLDRCNVHQKGTPQLFCVSNNKFQTKSALIVNR